MRTIQRPHPHLLLSLLICSAMAASGLAAPAGAGPVSLAAAAFDDAPPESQVDKDRLLAELKSLPTQRAANGRGEHIEGLRRSEDLLIDKLKQMGYTPTIHGFDFLGAQRQTDQKGERVPNRPWRNIIVDIPGKTRPAEMLVFTAHFDAVPRSPGATSGSFSFWTIHSWRRTPSGSRGSSISSTRQPQSSRS